MLDRSQWIAIGLVSGFAYILGKDRESFGAEEYVKLGEDRWSLFLLKDGSKDIKTSDVITNKFNIEMDKTLKRVKEGADPNKEAQKLFKKMEKFMNKYENRGASDTEPHETLAYFIEDVFDEKGYKNVEVNRFLAESFNADFTVAMDTTSQAGFRISEPQIEAWNMTDEELKEYALQQVRAGHGPDSWIEGEGDMETLRITEMTREYPYEPDEKDAESFEADVESVVSELRELGMPEIIFEDNEERIKINGELVYKMEASPAPIRDGIYSQPLFYIGSKHDRYINQPLLVSSKDGVEHDFSPPLWTRTPKGLIKNELKGPPINSIRNPNGITLKEVYLMFPNWDGNYVTWERKSKKPLKRGFNYFNAESFEAEKGSHYYEFNFEMLDSNGESIDFYVWSSPNGISYAKATKLAKNHAKLVAEKGVEPYSPKPNKKVSKIKFYPVYLMNKSGARGNYKIQEEYSPDKYPLEINLDAESFGAEDSQKMEVTFKIQDADYATFYYTTDVPSELRRDEDIVSYVWGDECDPQDDDWFYCPYDWNGVGEHYLAKVMNKTLKAESFEAEKKNCGCGQDPCVTYGAEPCEGESFEAEKIPMPKLVGWEESEEVGGHYGALGRPIITVQHTFIGPRGGKTVQEVTYEANSKHSRIVRNAESFEAEDFTKLPKPRDDIPYEYGELQCINCGTIKVENLRRRDAPKFCDRWSEKPKGECVSKPDSVRVVGKDRDLKERINKAIYPKRYFDAESKNREFNLIGRRMPRKMTLKVSDLRKALENANDDADVFVGDVTPVWEEMLGEPIVSSPRGIWTNGEEVYIVGATDWIETEQISELTFRRVDRAKNAESL